MTNEKEFVVDILLELAKYKYNIEQPEEDAEEWVRELKKHERNEEPMDLTELYNRLSIETTLDRMVGILKKMDELDLVEAHYHGMSMLEVEITENGLDYLQNNISGKSN